MNKATKDEIDTFVQRLEEIKSEEEEKRDNLEESFSETERYQQIEEIIEQLDQAIDALIDITSQ